MNHIPITNSTNPLQGILIVKYCNSFFCRLRGLMFQSRISEDKGILLVQPRDSRMDSSIHMLFVFMDLGVVWINSKNIVVDKVVAKAWHPAYAPREPARYTLEIHPSRINEFHIGNEIIFDNG